MTLTPIQDFSKFFPLEINLQIFNYLDEKDLACCRLVSSLFKEIAKHHFLWSQKAALFGISIQDPRNAQSEWFRYINMNRKDMKKAYNMGLIYKSQNNDVKVQKWFRKSARMGSLDAIKALNEIAISLNNDGGKRRWGRLCRLLVAANDGIPGSLYADEAFEVAKKFCDKNDPDFKQSYENAFKYLKKAAAYHHIEAKFWLGCAFYDGLGTPKSTSKACDYWSIAAESEHADAQFLMGRAHFLGEGVEKSDKKAVVYLKHAAKQNHDLAKELLKQIARKNPPISQKIRSKFSKR